MIYKKFLVIFLSAIHLILFNSCKDRPQSPSIKYTNGHIFDGDNFRKSSFVVQDGKFHFDTSIKFDSTIDLNENYVIPPFGDAHTHNFDDVTNFDSIYKAYINEGTFYVQVLTNHYSNYLKVKDSLNTPGRIDAKFAHGGITSTGGHPHGLYESQALKYSWRAMFDPEKKEEILSSRIKENDAYYLIDSISEVEEKWDSILANHPDLIKIYILNTAERVEKIANKEVGTYGLSEEVIEAIVKKAKASNITLVAHVETISDFEIALTSGVKYFAHMPGYGGGIGDTSLEELEIPDSLLQIAGKMNIRMTPTVSFAKYYANKWDGTKMSLDTTLLNTKYAFIRTQLRRFINANIKITLGTDQNESTLSEEIADLVRIDAFSNEELLNILINTSKDIFPGRKIGELKEGYEASFLVLKDNPLEDIRNINTIELRVKNGIVLD